MSADLLSEFNAFYSKSHEDSSRARAQDDGKRSGVNDQTSAVSAPSSTHASGAGFDWNPWENDAVPGAWRNEQAYDTSQAVRIAEPALADDDVEWGDFSEPQPKPPPQASRNETLADPWHEERAVKQLRLADDGDDPWGAFQAPSVKDAQAPQKAATGTTQTPATRESMRSHVTEVDPWSHLDSIGGGANASQTVKPAVQAPPMTVTSGEGGADVWDFFESKAAARGPEPPANLAVTVEPQQVWPYIPQHKPASSNITPIAERSRSRKTSRSPRPPRDENVLFDAEDPTTDEDGEEDGDDDFGEFATVEAAPPARLQPTREETASREALQDSLIDLDDIADSTVQQTLPITRPGLLSATTRRQPDLFDDLDDDLPAFASAHFNTDKNSQAEAATPVKSVRPESKAQESKAVDDASAWENWDDQASPQQAIEHGRIERSDSLLELPSLLSRRRDKLTDNPPPNVPPPALILSIFPAIFALVKSSLFDHIGESSSTPGGRTAVLSNPSTGVFLESYLEIARILSRIIAGRKVRWKRDTLLSQSMSIGQAASGKVSGMKLASIDKNETAREEREASNAVRLWKLQLGKLRSALTGTGITTAIPDVAEMLPVRTAQASEGAVSAPKPCVLCALRRNERVPKVDGDVQDSFGEWWVEHWGHRSCKDFWDSHEPGLRSK